MLVEKVLHGVEEPLPVALAPQHVRVIPEKKHFRKGNSVNDRRVGREGGTVKLVSE